MDLNDFDAQVFIDELKRRLRLGEVSVESAVQELEVKIAELSKPEAVYAYHYHKLEDGKVSGKLKGLPLLMESESQWLVSVTVRLEYELKQLRSTRDELYGKLREATSKAQTSHGPSPDLPDPSENIEGFEFDDTPVNPSSRINFLTSASKAYRHLLALHNGGFISNKPRDILHLFFAEGKPMESVHKSVYSKSTNIKGEPPTGDPMLNKTINELK